MSELTEQELIQSEGWVNCKWCPTSMAALQAAERKILSFLTKPYRGFFVNIGNRLESKQDDKIWTICMNEKSTSTPLVLVHGFAAGVGFWALNIEEMANNRPVYAFDLLGFGRSSRPTFSTDALVAEQQMIQSMEDWRESVGLDKFILLGHSLGGFLVSAYALKYPERIHHLVLLDPWGYPELPDKKDLESRIPVWGRAIMAVLSPFNPLAGLRAAGPWGPKLVGRLRSDLSKKFSHVIDDEEAIPQYIYHCNAQYPSGEIAFKTITQSLGWAKHPMMNRIINNDRNVPTTFIYGSRSWIDRQPAFTIQDARPDCQFDIQVISGAGHHVYADRPEQFNKLVQKVCTTAERRMGAGQNGASSGMDSEPSDTGYSSVDSGDVPASTADGETLTSPQQPAPASPVSRIVI